MGAPGKLERKTEGNVEHNQAHVNKQRNNSIEKTTKHKTKGTRDRIERGDKLTSKSILFRLPLNEEKAEYLKS